MDGAERLLEQYGSISISAPLLIPASKESPFKFDLPKQTAETHFLAARSERQTRQSLMDEMQLVAAVTAKAELSPEQIAARALELKTAAKSEALREESLALKRMAVEHRRNAAIAAIPSDASPEQRQKLTEEAAAKAKEDDAALLQERAGNAAYPASAIAAEAGKSGSNSNQAATSFLSSAEKPATPADLGETVIPVRSALITAAGDTATQGMLAVLGNPAQFFNGADKRVLFGVAMVNVDPGWKTKEDFLAEVAVQVSYAKKATPKSSGKCCPQSQLNSLFSGTGSLGENSGWVTRTDASPLVVAVSPMTDVQSTDFDSGVRRRIELSLALAASLSQAGMKAQAEVFASYARQLQSTVNMSTYQSTVTAYSLGGGIFGFRVGPRLGAEIAPGGKQTKSKMVHQLERVSFPVLVMVVVDQSDFPKDGSGEHAIQFSQTNRWLTQTHWLGRFNWGFVRGRMEEETIAQKLYKLDVATRNLEEALRAESQSTSVGVATGRTLIARARTISFLLGGSLNWQSIVPKALFAKPKEPKANPEPIINQVIPASVALNASGAVDDDVKLVILGQNLKGNWTASWLNEKKSDPSAAPLVSKSESGDSALVVILPKGSKPVAGANALKLLRAKDSSSDSAVHWTPPVSVIAAPKKSEPPPTADKDKPVTVTKTTKSKDGEVTEVYSAPVASADLLGKLIEKDKPVTKTPVNP